MVDGRCKSWYKDSWSMVAKSGVEAATLETCSMLDNTGQHWTTLDNAPREAATLETCSTLDNVGQRSTRNSYFTDDLDTHKWCIAKECTGTHTANIATWHSTNRVTRVTGYQSACEPKMVRAAGQKELLQRQVVSAGQEMAGSVRMVRAAGQKWLVQRQLDQKWLFQRQVVSENNEFSENSGNYEKSENSENNGNRRRMVAIEANRE